MSQILANLRGKNLCFGEFYIPKIAKFLKIHNFLRKWLYRFGSLYHLVSLFAIFGFQICIVEESGKQNKVRAIHEQTEFDVIVTDLAFQAILLDLVSPYVDQTSHNHLDQLQSGYDHC